MIVNTFKTLRNHFSQYLGCCGWKKISPCGKNFLPQIFFSLKNDFKHVYNT